jgi:hypothetical protein
VFGVKEEDGIVKNVPEYFTNPKSKMTAKMVTANIEIALPSLILQIGQ